MRCGRSCLLIPVKVRLLGDVREGWGHRQRPSDEEKGCLMLLEQGGTNFMA